MRESLENVKAGWIASKTTAIEEGRQIGPTPFGYTREGMRGGRPHGGLVPDPETAPIVRRAFELASEDVRSAMTFLTDAAPSKPWTLWTVERLLGSPVYRGHATYGELVNEDAHAAIVDDFTWRRAQHQVSERHGATERRAPAASYPLSGSSVCATCGGMLAGARAGRESRRIYRCTTNQRSGDARCERPATVSADPAEEHVRGLLVAHAQDREAELERAMANVTLGEARDTLAFAELEASSEEGPPEAEEIGQAEPKQLPEYLERFGLVVQVDPGRGNLPERVSLLPE